ncbi:Protein spaetzle [Trachymyrmex cornetzi]|uniref:Protein spaetzle n=1 Tax=Trachymyrmex cornetzi TaxID=471704 RepID=A0A195DUS6_9HYME|nr:Protein spaetzle [Trachymyrmex cornetzi]
MKEKVKSRFEANKDDFEFSEGWQVRNGGNHTEVTRCDYTKQTFCEDVPDYPQEFVNQMLAKNSNLIHYAYEDVIALSPRLDNEEEPLCLSTERLIRPKTAINMKNQWMYIVQAGENFFQSIRIETCIEQDRKCRMIDDFAEGYVTMCKQKYIYRELSAISQGGDIVRDYFRLPASCCCHVHFQAIEEKARIRSFL